MTIETTVNLAPNGRVVIPASMRAALGLTDGGPMVARLVDGAVVLEPIATSIRRAQAMVRRYVQQGGESLVDSLIAERRVEAERE